MGLKASFFISMIVVTILLQGCNSTPKSETYQQGMKMTDFSTLKTPNEIRPDKMRSGKINYVVLTYLAKKSDFAKLRINANEFFIENLCNKPFANSLNNIFYSTGSSGQIAFLSQTIDEVNTRIFSQENIIVYKDGFDKFELPPIDGVKTAYYYNLRNELAFEKLPSGRPAFLVASIIESDKSILITITPYFDDGNNFPDSLSKREPSLLKAGKTFFSGCEMSCRIGEGNFILIMPESLPMDERLFTTELFTVPKKEQFFKFYCVICGNIM